MCFGFQRNSARGDIENGTNDDGGVPARKVASSLRTLDGGGGGEKLDISEPPSAKPEKKKKWNDDEYGDSVSLALAAKRRQRIRELYPEGMPEGEQDKISRTQMSSGAMGGPMGGGAMMGM